MDAETVPASVSLKKIAEWDGTSKDVHQTLSIAFEADDYLACIRNLRGRHIVPLEYIDGLDEVSSYSPLTQYARFTTILRR
jgi:hypothetical protein